MRYYEIQAGPLRYSSLRPDGSNNAGALDIELELNIGYNDVPGGGTHVTVWGIGMSDISQQRNLAGKPITIRGGMSRGLPLANAAQAGLLCSGQIYQAVGNWVGTDQQICFIISPGSSPPTGAGPAPQQPPTPIVLNWRKGTDLRQALQSALGQAFPKLKLNMAIGKFTAPSDQVGFHANLENFGHFLRRYTQMLGGPGSEGVGINLVNGTLNVLDGSQPSLKGTIAYEDLIGQPTWVEQNKIAITTVMRADLHCGDKITLPRTPVTNTANAGYVAPGASGSIAPQTDLTFQGSFTVQQLRHLGRFRQPGGAWATVITATVESGGP